MTSTARILNSIDFSEFFSIKSYNHLELSLLSEISAYKLPDD